jgi:predicted HNH restriction endonuclease
VRWSVKLTASQYAAGLSAIQDRMSDAQRRILVAHYNSPHRTNYAKALARLAGIKSGHGTVNLEYWRLAELFCNATGNKPDVRPNGKRRWWSVWHQGYQTRYGFLWEMLAPVAEAMEMLGWHLDGQQYVAPDENPLASMGSGGTGWEGAVFKVTVNKYERDREARDKCIRHYGHGCAVCGFEFSRTYGPLADGFIHVHHIKPLSEIGERYKVDPIADLRPVCPNCHAVIHLGGQTRTIDEVRQLFASGNLAEQSDEPKRKRRLGS